MNTIKRLTLIATLVALALAGGRIRAAVPEPVAPGADVPVFAGDVTEFEIVASDPDGDNVNLQVDGLPAWATYKDCLIVAAPGREHVGQTAAVTITVTDDGTSYSIDAGADVPDPLTAQISFSLRVVRRNAAPTVGVTCSRR